MEGAGAPTSMGWASAPNDRSAVETIVLLLVDAVRINRLQVKRRAIFVTNYCIPQKVPRKSFLAGCVVFGVFEYSTYYFFAIAHCRCCSLFFVVMGKHTASVILLA